ncbi:peptidase C1A, papain [Seminavis robusta]|uniref:Peptidase C1A, papain n=1 Tax=Seminavis robusta TaxID=568900 RepID=A0A9N8HDQ5_9STRA|nr:peptidase C1A, papain [Seminavis robusta]|eukprot:Sro268_g103790.1 peptidase C1A, papain (548) ;mRNA; r:67631-69274
MPNKYGQKQQKINYLVNVVTGQFRSIGGAIAHPNPEKEKEFGKDYEPTRYQPDELPPAVDMRPFMTTVENQAGANSCAANAIVGGYEYIMKRNGVSIDFSRLFVYYNARVKAMEEEEKAEDDDDEGEEKQEGQLEDEGSHIGLGLQSLIDLGVCREKTWGYDLGEDDFTVVRVNDKPSEDSYKEAEHLKNVSQFQFEQPERVKVDLFTMKHCLAEGYPIVIGVSLYENFDYVDYSKTGRVPMPNLEGAKTRDSHGHHALLVVGYKDSAEHFIVRNSWGESWGDGGYCYMPYKYIANPIFCSEDCWIVKGNHANKEERTDYSQGIWDDKDEPFGPEFYEEYDPPQDVKMFSLNEAILSLCYQGACVDGMSEEESEAVERLFDEYGLGDDYGDKMDALIASQGFDAWRAAAVQIVMAHKEAARAFRISADFAFLDGKLTHEEFEYWKKLGKELKLPDEYVADTFATLLQEQPDTVSLVLPAPLKLHSRGVAVEQLQKGLTDAGYPVQVNGFFGKPTKQAVRSFQKDKGLKKDGIVGQKTWEVLFENDEE